MVRVYSQRRGLLLKNPFARTSNLSCWSFFWPRLVFLIVVMFLYVQFSSAQSLQEQPSHRGYISLLREFQTHAGLIRQNKLSLGAPFHKDLLGHQHERLQEYCKHPWRFFQRISGDTTSMLEMKSRVAFLLLSCGAYLEWDQQRDVYAWALQSSQLSNSLRMVILRKAGMDAFENLDFKLAHDYFSRLKQGGAGPEIDYLMAWTLKNIGQPSEAVAALRSLSIRLQAKDSSIPPGNGDLLRAVQRDLVALAWQNRMFHQFLGYDEEQSVLLARVLSEEILSTPTTSADTRSRGDQGKTKDPRPSKDASNISHRDLGSLVKLIPDGYLREVVAEEIVFNGKLTRLEACEQLDVASFLSPQDHYRLRVMELAQTCFRARLDLVGTQIQPQDYHNFRKTYDYFHIQGVDRLLLYVLANKAGLKEMECLEQWGILKESLVSIHSPVHILEHLKGLRSCRFEIAESEKIDFLSTVFNNFPLQVIALQYPPLEELIFDLLSESLGLPVAQIAGSISPTKPAVNRWDIVWIRCVLAQPRLLTRAGLEGLLSRSNDPRAIGILLQSQFDDLWLVHASELAKLFAANPQLQRAYLPQILKLGDPFISKLNLGWVAALFELQAASSDADFPAKEIGASLESSFVQERLMRIQSAFAKFEAFHLYLKKIGLENDYKSIKSNLSVLAKVAKISKLSEAEKLVSWFWRKSLSSVTFGAEGNINQDLCRWGLLAVQRRLMDLGHERLGVSSESFQQILQAFQDLSEQRVSRDQEISHDHKTSKVKEATIHEKKI